ncbi:MAG: oxygen-independent coproporphyrinogen III oxidase [Alphaproteobacteria bacterium]|nr:oxygen-independent coproporphyrinogen III oxidase [Alphaproteobacteria bacterium]
MSVVSPDRVRRWAAELEARVPRYTSYPTAPHFTGAVGPDTVKDWLGALSTARPVSLYVHVPFCRKLCLYCGCNTAIVSRHRPIGAFADDLLAEIDLVAECLPARLQVAHVHFGGGTPTALSIAELAAIRARLRLRFDIRPDAEMAIEIDPRGMNRRLADALAACGFNRASFGVQDFDPDVQRAIHREQPAEMVQEAVAMLRAVGIARIGFDLIYGLPLQTVAGVERTVELAARMHPDRVALFGYAHVPWMKPHQKALERHALPDASQRWDMAEAAARRLMAHGYERIGFDHFALPGDALAEAQRAGELRRNFQGYTTDRAETLIALGPSGISTLPQGYAQAVTDTAQWRKAVRAGELPVARGRALTDDDRLRRAVIGRLMCDLAVDVGNVARDLGRDPHELDDAIERLQGLAQQGIVALDGWRVRMADDARPLVRNAAACFDAYLAPEARKHAVAV